MKHTKENLLILRYLLNKTDALKELMGDLWPAFQQNLLALLDQIATLIPPADLQKSVDNLLFVALKTAARDIIRQAMIKSNEAMGIDSRVRSGQTLGEHSGLIYAELDKSQNVTIENLIDDINRIRISSPNLVKGVSETERHISAWLGERSFISNDPLMVGVRRKLNFKVGEHVQQSLITGPETAIPASDIPDSGLDTEWLITSSTIELGPMVPETITDFIQMNDSSIWTARFSLHIPKQGESQIIQLSVVAQTAEAAQLDVILYARNEIYRQFKVELEVIGNSPDRPAPETVRIVDDLVRTQAAELNLRTTHEWTTPPGEILITVFGSMAHVKGDAGSESVDSFAQWFAVDSMVAGPIINIRNSAEKFRRVWEKYLNVIDSDDLQDRLNNFNPQYDWANLNYYSDPNHEQLWDEAGSKEELWELAVDGYNLYDAFFPEGSDLRKWLDKLPPGQRLSVSWLQTSGPGFIPHVPWGLMYKSPLAPGDRVDPMLFLGLRYRISYTSHQVQSAAKALGGLNRVSGANLLYWGDKTGDTTGVEARWQQHKLSGWANQTFTPSNASIDRKAELLNMLRAPTPSPVGVLYFFCQCNVGDGNDPVLRFGNTPASSDTIRRSELGGGAFADRPLVFANACTTASADPYIANELERIFFNRGCRAYIGTESKVPIQLASRFAYIFFSFFYRRVDPQPMAAGEAISQARLFLWTHFKNIGGLFYSYVNQYEVFMADETEIRALRR